MHIKWDTRFMALAELVSSWSKDPSTKVGAVIADEYNRVVSVGYNGLPHGLPDDRGILDDRQMRLACTIHAEENALLFANRSVQDCRIYTYPVPPCGLCAAKILQSGMSEVVAPKILSDDFAERWKDSLKASRLILEGRVKVNLIQYIQLLTKLDD